MYYTIYLNFRERVIEKLLCTDNISEYSADISSVTGRQGSRICFAEADGKWKVCSDSSIIVTGPDELADGMCTGIEVKNTVQTGALFVSVTDNEKSSFERYLLRERVTVGTDSSSDIVLDGEFISRKHAEIVFSGDGYVIRNLSGNGIYINGFRTEGEKQLDVFDSVWIFGAKLIFTGEGIAVQKEVHFKECRLERADKEYDPDYGKKHFSDNTEIIRCRSVSSDRTLAVINPYEGTSETKEGKGISDILKTSVPAAALLTAAAALGGGFSAPASAAVFAGSTAFISGVWYSAKSASEARNNRNSVLKRQEYTAGCSEILKDAQDKFRGIMNERYPSADKAVRMYREHRQMIYGRSDDDFLVLRVCTGMASMRDFVRISDGCDREIREAAEKFSTAENVPEVIDIRNEKMIYVSGERELVFSFLRGLTVKISAFHSSEDVRMCFVLSEDEYENIDFVRWFPHVRSDDRSERYCAVNEEQSEHISDTIRGVLNRRSEISDDECYPHFIVFCSGNKMLNRSSLKKYSEAGRCTGVTFIVCDFSGDEKLIVTGKTSGIHIETAAPDTVSREAAVSYSVMRAADSENGSRTAPVPEKLGFIEMFRSQNISPTDNDIVYSGRKSHSEIKALLGMSADRKPFYLDFHESGHGPHGLIAGTTGSGKSELIQTVILSLALSYSPEETAFVLIDYKGGGMSHLFEGLPHTAGILTNLSGNQSETGRVLLSLSGEIKKRQRIFKDYSVNHIDSYMKLYDEGRAVLPLPHLIIICDEFAELKKEQPGFISELISISRVGRSLGIHLVLATQKPSGVVDDEIKSNAGFRICLKVQDRNDSTEMISVPDAAGITVPGRAIILTSGDNGYETVQTGYSGGRYRKECDEKTVRMILCSGSSALKETEDDGDTAITETEYITGKIIKHCRQNNISPARKIWTDPLEENITLSSVRTYGETVSSDGPAFTAGVTDDPSEQKQYPAVFDFSETGNILVAGRSGSGKTMFIHTMLCSLSENYNENELKFFLADMSGGISSVFAESANCGRVMISPDEREIRAFLDEISAETERRKRMFSDAHTADFSEYRELCSDICPWVVCIDGYGMFREMYPSEDEYFTRLSGEAAKYGIYFVLTVKQLSDIRARIRQNFRTAAVLALNDRTEYTDFLGIRPETELPSQPGCGYLVSEGKVLVFQTALCCSGKGRERYSQLSDFFRKINGKNVFYGDEISEKYCNEVPCITSANCISLAEKNLKEGRVLIWSPEKNTDIPGAECFYGEDEIREMLFVLKDIFTERNMKRKISGTAEWEPVAVILRGLDAFCSCLYRDGKKDEAVITEKFLSGGEGLGVSFFSETEVSPLNRNCEVFRIFNEKSTGGAEC